MLLEGKVAIVSGIGPGLGRHAALQLARQGAAVVLGARTEERLKELADEIEGFGGRAAYSPTNIREADQCEQLARTALDEFGRIDVLVNNAFRPDAFQPFESVDLEQWKKIHEVNVWGTLQMTRAVVPTMKEQGAGSIVMVNSMVIRKPSGIAEGGYATSKGALLVAARILAHELGPYGIRVNSVVPGFMAGPGFEMYLDWQSAEQERTREEIAEEVASRTALRRVVSDEECAGAIVFLASDLAAAVTGQAVDVNGGEVFD